MHGNYIDGEWMAARGRRTRPNRNPAHIDTVLGEFPDSTAADVADAVAAAHHAFPVWRATPMLQRGEILFRAAELLGRYASEVAAGITREQGKTFREARSEVTFSIGLLRYFAAEAMQPDGEVYPPLTSDVLLFTRHEPIGTIGAITPWNYPLSLPVRKVAPALIFGNTVVLKPSELTPLSAAWLTAIFHEAGLPHGVLNLVQGRGAVVGSALVGHQQIAGISFTGSNEVGRDIQRRLVERNAKVQLELGGKNVMIVLADADIDRAVQWTLNGAMRLSGQKCTATSRVIVEERIADEFTAKLVAQVRLLKVGDGMAPDTFLGPVISEAQQSRVLDYLHIGISEGAEVLAGGDALENGSYDEGYYVAPTVFGSVQSGMRLMQEEIFGPVVGVVSARDFEDAIEIANVMPFGFSASISTRDIQAALRSIDSLAAGVVHINRESAHNDFHVPSGGVKASASHRPEAGKAARDFYTDTKTVYLQAPGEQ